jgi:hypothetical protein
MGKMLKREAESLVSTLELSYRQFGPLPDDQKSLYVSFLMGWDYEVADRAIQQLIAESHFRPDVSDIRKKMAQIGPEIRHGEAEAKQFREGVDWLVRFKHMSRDDATTAMEQRNDGLTRFEEYCAMDPDDPRRPAFQSAAEFDAYFGFD